MKKLINVFIALLALSLTYLIIIAIPGLNLNKYNLQSHSISSYKKNEKSYPVDLNHDGDPETIVLEMKNTAWQSIVINKEKNVLEVFTFDKNETFISQEIYFADLDNNNNDEWIFVTADEKNALLNIVEFDIKNRIFSRKEKIIIDSFNFYNNECDIANYDIIVDGADIFFDLQAGYSVQPRNIYRYNNNDKSLIKTKSNSITFYRLKLITRHNTRFILTSSVFASGNTISPADSFRLSHSTHPDSLLLYKAKKNKVYRYGDFASYILLYNDKLDFAFEPVSFYGWTNHTVSDCFWQGNIPIIVSITNSYNIDSVNKIITLCNLQGEIIKQVITEEDYTNVFTDSNRIVLRSKNALQVNNRYMEQKEVIENITGVFGFIDIDNDGQKEFVASNENSLLVFTNDFSHRTSFKIGHEPTSVFNPAELRTFVKDGVMYFQFHSNMFYYVFSYTNNKMAVFKYPFYILLFSLLYAAVWFVVQLNSKRLEKEKQNLEQIVAERTMELQSKNSKLAQQKEEIQAQAETLFQQNEHLEKLGQFKESLTHTLVHDLKNPLGQILHCTSIEHVTPQARKMLQLVTNLLDVEKYENTKFLLSTQLQSLRNMLEDVRKGQEPGLKEKNLKLLLHFEDFMVLADKDVIIRVFDNLLSNAIRFSPNNNNIEVFAQENTDETVKISMKNYGEKIRDDALLYIFDKFRYFSKTDSDNHHSTGLGLTFCKMAIAAHGHSITAQNIDDGVVFSFTLKGKNIPLQNANSTKKADQMLVLTPDEQALLNPFLDRLKKLKVYQVSEIMKILLEIPGSTANLKSVKQRIRDAAFASNAGLFRQILSSAECKSTSNNES